MLVENDIAAFFKGKTYAFGVLADISEAFSNKLKSEIIITDVNIEWLKEGNFFKGLLYDIIAFTLINKCKMSRIGKKRRKFYLKNAKIKTTGLPEYLTAYEALEISLDFRRDYLWLILLPTIEVFDSRDLASLSLLEKKQVKLDKKRIINRIISGRYNIKVDEKLDKWLSYLKKKLNPIVFSIGDFKIEVDNEFAFGGNKYNDKNYFFPGLSMEDEPKLYFHVDEKKYKSIHPLKGLKNFGPYDYSFGNSINTSTIKKKC